MKPFALSCRAMAVSVFASAMLLSSPAAAAEGPEAPCAAMTPRQVRRYEDEVREAYRAGDRSPETMRRVADLALIPPKLNTSPLPEYDYDRL